MRIGILPWIRGMVAGALLVAVAGGAASPSVAAPGDAPIRIAFVGDSMADGLWGALFRRLGKDKCLAEKVKLVRKAKNGTGLTRLDQYNWINEVATLAADPGTDLFVGSFGINDRQPIVEPDKTRTDFGGAAFETRYLAHVEDLIHDATAKGASILLVGLPVMLDGEANADALAKNKIFADAVKASGTPLAAYAQPWSSQSGPDEYKPFLPNAHNALSQVRANDGIHFTTFGYDLVMDSIYPAILASLKQRGRDLSAECPGEVGTR
jgi:uncharacterized protein